MQDRRVTPLRIEPVSMGRHHLTGDLEHDVHAAALLDVLALHAVQPQHLGVALVVGLHLAARLAT